MNIDKNEQEIIKNAINKCFVSMSKNCLEIRPNEVYLGASLARSLLFMFIITYVFFTFIIYNKFDDDFIGSYLPLAIVLFWLCGIEYIYLTNNKDIKHCFQSKNKKMLCLLSWHYLY